MVTEVSLSKKLGDSMRDAEILGLSTEIQCQLVFTQLNIVLSKPITSDSRYDFIADVNGKLLRIQCKSSSVSEDGTYIQFGCRSTGKGANGNYQLPYNKDEIDYFYTCYNGVSYLVPVEECGSTSKHLRFSAKETRPSISWAEDYEISKALNRYENFESKYMVQNNVIAQKENKNHCIDCGAVISQHAIRCHACYAKQERLIERPNREELKHMIRKMSFTTIGKQYGITDNAIRKWCKAENLPVSKREIDAMTDEQWNII